MSGTTEATRENPYVGPRPFDKSDPLYGRDREVRDLRDLLIARRIVMFFSPSGAGKTSLIKAQGGLLWELQRADFRVLPVGRVNQMPDNGQSAGANRYVLSALLSLDGELPHGQQRTPRELARLTLKEYLDSCPRAEGDPASDILVFDQFEEILTQDPTDPEAKAAFFDQVGDVLRDRSRWALFSLREDHIAALDPYLSEIPTRLATTFRLDFLGEAAGRLAMQRPVAGSEVEFTDDAARRLADDLRRVRVQQAEGPPKDHLGPHIEPVHLKVVCQRLWEHAAHGTKRIDPQLVAKVGDVDRALRAFYADAVKAVVDQTGVAERDIRVWFDEHLITKQGIRGQLLEETEESGGLPAAAIDALVDRHLVRRELRRGAQWLELAHDRLIDPVRADNNDWYPINLSVLQQQAALWDSQRRESGYLLTGAALLQAEQWAEDNPGSLSELEQEFLD